MLCDKAANGFVFLPCVVPGRVPRRTRYDITEKFTHKVEFKVPGKVLQDY